MLNDEVIAEVVAGPLEGFVARRDALAKELKTAGETDDSAAVKRLRKPSRLAWALDAAAQADPDAIERVAAAVHAVVEAQEGRGDMREATRALRDSVHAAAGVASAAATDAGLSVARADLVPALMAVVGDAGAFDQLRKAHLGEIPAAGGFEPAPLTRAPLVALSAPDGAAPASRPADAAAAKRARSAVEQAEAAAASARDEAEAAEQAVDDADAAVEAANDALQQAETEARHAADRLRLAKRAAKAARDNARQADRTASAARAKLQEVEG